MKRFGEPQATHDWVFFGLGRRCSVCGLTQLRGEFDDTTACARRGAASA
jgi:hypothetical protein